MRIWRLSISTCSSVNIIVLMDVILATDLLMRGQFDLALGDGELRRMLSVVLNVGSFGFCFKKLCTFLLTDTGVAVVFRVLQL